MSGHTEQGGAVFQYRSVVDKTWRDCDEVDADAYGQTGCHEVRKLYLHAERARVPDAFLVQVVKDGEAWEHRWYVPRWGDPDPSPMNGKPYCINGVEHPELGSYRVKAFVALEGKS